MTQQTTDRFDELRRDIDEQKQRRIAPGLLVRSAELLVRIDDVLAAGPTGRAQ